MEPTTVKEVAVDVIPNQFWGAIKIFTEKPHVINRRICGTTNLWIGVCEERDYNAEEVLASVVTAIESDRTGEDKRGLEESTLENNIEKQKESHMNSNIDCSYENTSKEKHKESLINSNIDSSNENTSRTFDAQKKEEDETQKSRSESGLKNEINSNVDSENEATGRKLSMCEEEEQDIQESMLENNLQNHFHSKMDYENMDTGRKLGATAKEEGEMQQCTLETNIQNNMNLEVDCEKEERGGKLNASLHHVKQNLIHKKLEACHFKLFSSDDMTKAQDGCEALGNEENDDGDDTKGQTDAEMDHVAGPQDDCQASENNNKDNDNNNDNGCEAASKMDDAGNSDLQDDSKTSGKDTNNDKNDNNATEGEITSRTGRQSPPQDHREGKFSIPWGDLTKTSNTIAIIRKILPKQADKFASVLEVILLDGVRKKATYITETRSSQPSINPKANYAISLTSSRISLSCLGGENEGNSSVAWLTKNVLPKVVKWASEVSVDGLVDDRGSLKLVDVAEYNEVYQRLKMKYGKPLVKIWPEVTDPLKFVYEDIAIATYLILLWRRERQRKGLSSLQSFVDLGCGNGLLVYILLGEGHKGLGIDVKKRKIWDLFPGCVELKEAVIEPSDKNLFPEYDWLIGNHSDELTPWIPVIAAKSSYNSRFFVIPCCAHDFSQKYRRRHAGRSQYSDYLEYVKEIGAVCGYNVKQDKLRIPSTKRICLVGDERTVDTPTYGKLSEVIDAFIKERTEATKEASDEGAERGALEHHTAGEEHGLASTDMWTADFKARESVQPVRNCTQLKRSIREDIISAIVGVLMEKKHLVEVDTGNNETQTTVTWDHGGSMTLGDLAKRLDRPLLGAMKKECGGLQTLLKNHRYIFNLSNGLVSLQVPQPAWKKTTPNTFTKTKLCWFHTHHRSGCPLPSEVCMFAHGEEDLRSKQDS